MRHFLCMCAVYSTQCLRCVNLTGAAANTHFLRLAHRPASPHYFTCLEKTGQLRPLVLIFVYAKETTMDPTIWGVAAWEVLVCAACKLPQHKSIQLFESMSQLLPCVHCRNSYNTYITKLVPSQCINNEPQSALRFIWAVHDYVNEKLARHPMPFSRLSARVLTFSQQASALLVLDVLALVALQIETDEQVEAYNSVFQVFLDLVACVDECPHITVEFTDEFKRPEAVWLHALKCRNALQTLRGLTTIRREEFRAQYANCSTPDANKGIVPPQKTQKSMRSAKHVSRTSGTRGKSRH